MANRCTNMVAGVSSAELERSQGNHGDGTAGDEAAARFGRVAAAGVERHRGGFITLTF